MRIICWLAMLGVGAAAASASAQVPTGARVESSGFLTIEQAPPAPAAERPKRSGPTSELGYYAELAGVDNAEAQKRVAEQQRTRPQFERVLAAVRKGERGNFTDVRMIHRPDWAYVFYFKRNPQATLAKYTKFAHFKAARARYSHAELKAIAKPWVERFMAERMLTGHGTDATFGEASMDLTVSEAEYREIAARAGWGAVPDAIKLNFSPAVRGEAVPADLRRFVRGFSQADRALGITLDIAIGGRIVLRDGCFVVTRPGQPDGLAFFPREVGLSRDPQNYLALRSRIDGEILGRVGEQFRWGGSGSSPPASVELTDLKARCGNLPVTQIGMPRGAAIFGR